MNTKISNSQAKVLYDGLCPLCLKSVSILRRLDWFHRLCFRDARLAENIPEREPPLDPARLIEEMHLITPDGEKVYSGFKVFRWMAWRLPLLWLIAPFLYIPGVPFVGQKVYLWIARNRFQLVSCRDGYCEVPALRDAQKRQSAHPGEE